MFFFGLHATLTFAGLLCCFVGVVRDFGFCVYFGYFGSVTWIVNFVIRFPCLG